MKKTDDPRRDYSSSSLQRRPLLIVRQLHLLGLVADVFDGGQPLPGDRCSLRGLLAVAEVRRSGPCRDLERSGRPALHERDYLVKWNPGGQECCSWIRGCQRERSVSQIGHPVQIDNVPNPNDAVGTRT